MAFCFSHKVYMYLAGRYNDCLFQFINSSKAYAVNTYCFYQLVYYKPYWTRPRIIFNI